MEQETILQLLTERGLFEGASTDMLSQLVSHGHEVEIAPEALLIEQGKIGEAVWILLSGTVRIIVDGKESHHLNAPATLLGEISAVSQTPATATVQAHDKVLALRITHQDFHKALNGSKELANLVLRSLSKYL